MGNEKGRRLHYDDFDNKIYKQLSSSKIFKSLDIVDLFSIALVYGKKADFRTKLEKEGKTIGRVVEQVIDKSQLRYLMMAIAVDEKKDLEVLIDSNEYFTISEEYAKAGLKFFESDYIEKGDKLLEDMKTELLDLYEEYFEE